MFSFSNLDMNVRALSTLSVKQETSSQSSNQSSKTDSGFPADKKNPPEDKWAMAFNANREEFYNVLLGGIIVVLAFHLMREKGEKLEEGKKLRGDLEKLQEYKSKTVQFIDKDIPKLVDSSGLSKAKAEALSANIRAGFEKSTSPPAVSDTDAKVVTPDSVQSVVKAKLF
jgi:hypothetical protein